MAGAPRGATAPRAGEEPDQAERDDAVIDDPQRQPIPGIEIAAVGEEEILVEQIEGMDREGEDPTGWVVEVPAPR